MVSLAHCHCWHHLHRQPLLTQHSPCQVQPDQVGQSCEAGGESLTGEVLPGGVPSLEDKVGDVTVPITLDSFLVTQVSLHAGGCQGSGEAAK